MLLSVLLPSNASAGARAMRPAPNSATRNIRSSVSITRFLARAARMGDRAVDGGPHLLRVFPQITRTVFVLPRLPLALALGQFVGGQLHVERSFHRIDLDDVAIADQPDRPADRSFRPDMADAEAARRAGETSVGDECDFFTGALAVQCGRRREHL